ncbi:MAG: hypothetical protein ABJN42_21600 [Roseibium sp.]|uniref:hypothetical protein n=1 Tax=Roseibium sp. TaxID=1936156 RepID=UPI003297C7D4
MARADATHAGRWVFQVAGATNAEECRGGLENAWRCRRTWVPTRARTRVNSGTGALVPVKKRRRVAGRHVSGVGGGLAAGLQAVTG